MPKRKKSPLKPKKPLDRLSERRGRGRPAKIPPSWVLGRAENYRICLTNVWSRLRTPLLAAETQEQVIAAFEVFGQPYAGEFVPRLASEILSLIEDSKFPKRPEPQLNFVADSLAGRPNVGLRTSRDICGRERKKKVHYIVRRDFYIECTCRYKGPALHGQCPSCGTGKLRAPLAIPFS
jgi:hypothetical protein